jgi:hypothetical protein
MHAAREQLAGLYSLEGVADDAERQQVLNGLPEGHAFLFRAEDHALSPCNRGVQSMVRREACETGARGFRVGDEVGKTLEHGKHVRKLI